MKALTENTYVPIGLAIIVIGTGAAWVTSVQISTASNTQKIIAGEQNDDKILQTLLELKSEVGEVKGELKQLNRRMYGRREIGNQGND